MSKKTGSPRSTPVTTHVRVVQPAYIIFLSGSWPAVRGYTRTRGGLHLFLLTTTRCCLGVATDMPRLKTILARYPGLGISKVQGPNRRVYLSELAVVHCTQSPEVLVIIKPWHTIIRSASINYDTRIAQQILNSVWPSLSYDSCVRVE